MLQAKDLKPMLDENKVNLIIIDSNVEKANEYEKKVQEHLEKQQQIIDLIKSEAEQGIVHNMKSFAMKFQYTYTQSKTKFELFGRIILKFSVIKVISSSLC